MNQAQKVTVDGVNYLIDENAEIREKDWYYEAISENQINKAFKNIVSNHYQKKIVGIEFPHKLEGVYQYKLPDEDVKKLFDVHYKHINYTSDSIYKTAVKRDFIAGYKANKATYTEEDVFNFLNYIREYEDFYDYVDGEPKFLKSLITSWKVNRNKEIESIEIVMEQLTSNMKEIDSPFKVKGNYSQPYTYKLTPEGLLDIDVKYK